jgi:hypothetical protein
MLLFLAAINIQIFCFLKMQPVFIDLLLLNKKEIH